MGLRVLGPYPWGQCPTLLPADLIVAHLPKANLLSADHFRVDRPRAEAVVREGRTRADRDPEDQGQAAHVLEDQDPGVLAQADRVEQEVAEMGDVSSDGLRSALRMRGRRAA